MILAKQIQHQVHTTINLCFDCKRTYVKDNPTFGGKYKRKEHKSKF